MSCKLKHCFGYLAIIGCLFFLPSIQGNSQKLICDKSLPKSRDASFSPDGKKIIFASNRNGDSDIFIMDADGNNVKLLIRTPEADHYPFFSHDGTKITFDSYGDGTAIIYMLDADGENMKNLTDIGAFNVDPNISPNGKKIVFYSNRDGKDQIYMMNIDGSDQRRVTQTNSNEQTPVWSPDGEKILFISSRDGNAEIYTMLPDGSEQTRLTNNPGLDRVARWSPDGNKIIFYSKSQPKTIDPNEQSEITIMDADGSNRVRLTNDKFPDQGPVISPDGKTILFTSCRGNQEIYSMNVDGSNLKQLTRSLSD